jgi:hypothetical protein
MRSPFNIVCIATQIVLPVHFLASLSGIVDNSEKLATSAQKGTRNLSCLQPYLAIFVSAGSLPVPIQWCFARFDSVCITCIWLIALVCYTEQLLQTLKSVTDPEEEYDAHPQRASSVVRSEPEKRLSLKKAAKYSLDPKPPNL